MVHRQILRREPARSRRLAGLVGAPDHHPRAGRVRQPELHGLLLAFDVLSGRLGPRPRHAEARRHDAGLPDRRLRRQELDGIYAGAHSRVYDREVLEKWNVLSSDFGWVLFGLGHPLSPPSSAILFYVLASAYQPPEILQRIATDRSQPYTEYERKRTRNRWRFFDELHGPVYKTTYVRREYAVGSDQGGTLQPIQEHSWDVTWSVPDPRGVQNTLFTLNPHSSLHELQTYFTFPPDIGISGVVSSKKSYDSPDKFVGGSPYEKIFQDRDTIVALYDIPPDSRFPHINGFFSKDLSEVREDPSGWIFARGGDALIACRPLRTYTWKPIEGGGRRLFSPYLKNGIVVQVAARSEFTDMDAFRRAILALPLEFSLDPTPSVTLPLLARPNPGLHLWPGSTPQRRSHRLRSLAAFWGAVPGSPRGFRTPHSEVRHHATHTRFPPSHSHRQTMRLLRAPAGRRVAGRRPRRATFSQPRTSPSSATRPPPFSRRSGLPARRWIVAGRRVACAPGRRPMARDAL